MKIGVDVLSNWTTGAKTANRIARVNCAAYAKVFSGKPFAFLKRSTGVIWGDSRMGVLVIDPEETSRRAVCEALKWADRRYAIKVATDGSGSWPLALQLRPRLVICEPV